MVFISVIIMKQNCVLGGLDHESDTGKDMKMLKQ